MALLALSESWLFKELGDTHWELLCKGLNSQSYDLANDTGERLYATFVRIRIHSKEHSLYSFNENEVATLEGGIKRFGNSMYFSDIGFSTDNASFKAELMTTFSIRDKTDNTHLSKSEPADVINSIDQEDRFPAFGNEYRLVKKKVLESLSCGEFQFSIIDSKEPIFTIEYDFNAYYDMNGVNLLYFAAYPIINDVCEAKYFNSIIDNRWEQNYYTCYKDVFYYGNCNLDDSLTYELLESVKLSDGIFKNTSILRRNSDNEIIARIFSVKRKQNT